MVIQGRRLDESDMVMIRGLLDANPGWNRTRNDRHTRIHVPVKDVYLYPLGKDFMEALRDDHA